MINSQDIKKGTAIRMDGGIWVCIDFQHRKPGKGNTIMIIKVKNVSDGRVLERSSQLTFWTAFISAEAKDEMTTKAVIVLMLPPIFAVTTYS